MKNYLLTFLFAIITIYSYSQINELGLHIGGSNYIGDVGDEMYIRPNNLSYGLIYKWNANPRMALRLSGSYIPISDDDAKSTNEIRKARGYSFKNTIKEAAIGIEYNYYNYSLRKEGWNSTPYIIVEFAVFNYNAVVDESAPNIFVTESKTRFTVPFGFGYKTKLANDIGIGLEIKARYTFTNDLDYNNFDYLPLSFGNPDSNDWYITVGFNLVFGFGRKDCYSVY